MRKAPSAMLATLAAGLAFGAIPVSSAFAASLDFVEAPSSPEPIGPGFQPDWAAGSERWPLTAADFDGDGDDDLAVATQLGVQILKSNGSGAFFEPPSSPELPAEGTKWPVAADFDRDGDQDLAVSRASGFPFVSEVRILRNNGSGNFWEPTSSSPVPVRLSAVPNQAVALDVNGDGDTDLATASGDYWGGRGGVTILQNNGAGHFFEPPASPELWHEGGGGATTIASGDLDGDGDGDLVVDGFGGGDFTRLLKHIGLNNFYPTRNLTTADYSRAHPFSTPVAADFDGDGDLDVALANRDTVDVTVLYNRGDGFPAARLDFEPSPNPSFDDPRWLAAADFDLDGDHDLAVLNAQSAVPPVVTILGNDGAGTFTPAPSSPEAVRGWSQLTVGDFDADGDPDLAAVGQKVPVDPPLVTVLLNQ